MNKAREYFLKNDEIFDESHRMLQLIEWIILVWTIDDAFGLVDQKFFVKDHLLKYVSLEEKYKRIFVFYDVDHDFGEKK